MIEQRARSRFTRPDLVDVLASQGTVDIESEQVAESGRPNRTIPVDEFNSREHRSVARPHRLAAALDPTHRFGGVRERYVVPPLRQLKIAPVRIKRSGGKNIPVEMPFRQLPRLREP